MGGPTTVGNNFCSLEEKRLFGVLDTSIVCDDFYRFIFLLEFFILLSQVFSMHSRC